MRVETLQPQLTHPYSVGRYKFSGLDTILPYPYEGIFYDFYDPNAPGIQLKKYIKEIR